MNIEIINKEGNLITSYNMEAVPFKVGETIHITVSNYDKEFWTNEEVKGSYVVDKIEHYLRQDYLSNHKYSVSLCVSVEVTKVK